MYREQTAAAILVALLVFAGSSLVQWGLSQKTEKERELVLEERQAEHLGGVVLSRDRGNYYIVLWEWELALYPEDVDIVLTRASNGRVVLGANFELIRDRSLWDVNGDRIWDNHTSWMDSDEDGRVSSNDSVWVIGTWYRNAAGFIVKGPCRSGMVVSFIWTPVNVTITKFVVPPLS